MIEYLALNSTAQASGLGGARPGAGSLFQCPAARACKLASLATWHPGVTIMFTDIVGESGEPGKDHVNHVLRNIRDRCPDRLSNMCSFPARGRRLHEHVPRVPAA